MLFYCFWRSIDTSCHKHFVDTSCDQQTPPLTTNNKCHSLSWSAPVLITPTSRSIDNTMKPDTGFGGNHIFASHLHSTTPFGGLLLEYCHNVWYGKTRMVWLPDGQKIIRFRMIHECDRHTNTHTHSHTQILHDGISWTMHSIAWQKCYNCLYHETLA